MKQLDLTILSTEIKLVTPDAAKRMLLRNDNNRKMSLSTIRKYAKDMSNGDWQLNHQGIAFDEFGNLVDGQQRLSAVIMSNTPITTMVTIYKGNLSAMNIIIDDQIKRTISVLTGLPKDRAMILSNIVRFSQSSINNNKVSPSTVIAVNCELSKYFDKFKEYTNYSTGTNASNDDDILLRKLWISPVKLAFFSAIVGEVYTKNIINIGQKKHSQGVEDFFDWKKENIYGGGSDISNYLTCVFWNIIKYNKFIDPSDDMKIAENKVEIKNIYKEKIGYILK